MEAEGKMDRKDFLAVILIFLSPLPFLSNSCLASFSVWFMTKEPERLTQTHQAYLNDIYTFRIRQLSSALWTIFLFGTSLIIAYLYLKLKIANILWVTVVATMLLTHSVFNQLGWKLRWGGDNLLLERMNLWAFRALYSIGVILLFLTMMYKIPGALVN